MRKILLQTALFIISPFCGVVISAQNLTINHTLEGDMANEITQALTTSGQTASQIENLTIVSDNAIVNYTDFVAIKESFKASLKKADVSACTFVNNRLPSSGAWEVNGAFTGMKLLEEVVLPADLLSLGGGAFNGCSALTTVNLPVTLKTIESYAFKNCVKIEFEELPDAITHIFQEAFNGCTLLALNKLPASLKIIDQQAFLSCKGITASNLPENLETIGNEVFNGCSNVKFASFPTTIKSIGLRVFRNTQVAFTEWPANLPVVPVGVFANVPTVVNFTFPATVTSIGTTSLYVADTNLERTFTSRALTPPTADDASEFNSFGKGYDKMNLRVLRSAKNAYMNQVPWSKMNIEVISHPLTISIVGEGDISTSYDFSEIEQGRIDIAELDNISFNLIPKAGQILSHVFLDNVDIVSQVESGVLSFASITKAHTLEVVFATPTSIDNEGADVVNISSDVINNLVYINGAKDKVKLLYNMSGNLLLNTKDNQIDISSLTSGVYFLKINDEVFKFIKR